MLDDVKCIEKNPERMWRICEPSVSERVSGKQVAELVVNFRLRHVQPEQKRHARQDRDRTKSDNGEPPVSREPRKFALYPSKNRIAQSLLGPEEKQTDGKDNPF